MQTCRTITFPRTPSWPKITLYTECKSFFYRRVPVEGKSSVCLICMKYRILILIIIIIILGEILLSYIANTSRTHALAHVRTRARTHAHARTHTHTHRAHAHTRTHAHTHTRTHAHTHTHRRLSSGSMLLWRRSVTKLRPSFMAGSWVIEINTRGGDPIYLRFWRFFAYKKNARPN